MSASTGRAAALSPVESGDGVGMLLGGIGERVREVGGGLSAGDLARLMSLSEEAVRGELGSEFPSVGFVAALCAALGLSADWVLCGRGEPRVGTPARERRVWAGTGRGGGRPRIVRHVGRPRGGRS